jgi:hypothetical protein
MGMVLVDFLLIRLGIVLLLNSGFHPCHCLQVVVNPYQQRCQQKRHYHLSQQPQRLTSVEDDIQSSDSTDIRVYDNIYPPETCLELHQLAKSHADRIGDDSTLFYRISDNDDGMDHTILSPLEYAIDSILTNVCNDTTTRVVEYWSRQEYINMDTHCDLDEYTLDEHETVRCPEWAHILYLVVQPNTTAPTCIFPKKQGGWMTSLEEHDESVATILDLVVIPAVPGRLVRFPGNAMHAVPKPPHRWFMSQEEEALLRQQQQAEENVDSDVDRMDRSVILFNCWSNESPPPKGIDRDYVSGGLPDGIVVDDDDDEDNGDGHCGSLNIQLGTEQSTTLYSPIYDVLDAWYPTALATWSESTVQSVAQCYDEVQRELRIRLLGKKYRRQYSKAVAKIVVNDNTLRRALYETIAPSYIQLRETVERKE